MFKKEPDKKIFPVNPVIPSKRAELLPIGKRILCCKPKSDIPNIHRKWINESKDEWMVQKR
jgi:hypothetical protein